MKNYRVIVNGTAYEVALEEIDASQVKTVSAPAASEEAPAQKVTASEGGEVVSAPMPGTILSVNVTAGKAVKSGDILFILEAMKMENEILAPCDGTVQQVSVSGGQSVDTGAVLCVIA